MIRKNLRKLNAIVSCLILVLLIVHGIAGGFQMMSVLPGGNTLLEVLAWVMAGMIALHAVIGIWLTIETVTARKKAGRSYLRQNLGFWVRRISGFAMLLFVALHLLIFAGGSGAYFRLGFFGNTQLTVSLLLVASLVIHVLCNLKALSISFGAGWLSRIRWDLLLVLAAVLVFCASAFLIYYLRWNVLWRFDAL